MRSIGAYTYRSSMGSESSVFSASVSSLPSRDRTVSVVDPGTFWATPSRSSGMIFITLVLATPAVTEAVGATVTTLVLVTVDPPVTGKP